MPLVPALCTQCGSKLEIDAAKEAAICPYCDTPFVTEKAINHYNTTNVIHAGVVNVSDSHSIDNRIKAGETFIKLGDYVSAINIFTSLTEEYPYDYRSWWGFIKAITKDLNDFGLNQTTLLRVDTSYQKACKVASPEEIQIIEGPYRAYYDEVRTKQEKFIRDTEREIQELSEAFENDTKDLRTQIAVLNEERTKKSKFFIISIVIAVILVVIGIAKPWVIGTNVFIAAILIIIGVKVNQTKPKRIDSKLYPLGEKLRNATGEYQTKLNALQARLATIKS